MLHQLRVQSSGLRRTIPAAPFRSELGIPIVDAAETVEIW